MAFTELQDGSIEEKERPNAAHQENIPADEQAVKPDDDSQGNLIYENDEEEPELHARTYVAFGAMFLLNLVQVFALQGPPAVVTWIV